MFGAQAEFRRRVMLGELPPDFLRLDNQPVNPPPFPENFTAMPSPPSDATAATGVAVSGLKIVFPVQLCLTVEKAELTSSRLATMDPYVIVRLGQTCLRTNTHLRGGKKPIWSKIFQVSLPHNIRTIFFNLFDENMFVTDKCIGSATCTLPDKLFDGSYINIWLPIYNKDRSKAGKLHIYAYLIPSESSDEVQASAPPPVVMATSFATSAHAPVPPPMQTASAPFLPSPPFYAVPPRFGTPFVFPTPTQDPGYGILNQPFLFPSVQSPLPPCVNPDLSLVTNGVASATGHPVFQHPVFQHPEGVLPHSCTKGCTQSENGTFESAVLVLCEMFPDKLEEDLAMILHGCSGDIVAAVDRIVHPCLHDSKE